MSNFFKMSITGKFKIKITKSCSLLFQIGVGSLLKDTGGEGVPQL